MYLLYCYNKDKNTYKLYKNARPCERNNMNELSGLENIVSAAAAAASS